MNNSINNSKFPLIEDLNSSEIDDDLASSSLLNALGGFNLVKVQGLSMFDPNTGEGYPEGCLVRIETSIEAEDGDDVLVRTPSNKVALRRLHTSSEGKFLAVINPDWDSPIIEISDDSVICGVADGYFMKGQRPN